MMNDAHIHSCSESHLCSRLNKKNDALLIWKYTTRPCRKSTYFAAFLIHIHQATVNNMSYSEQYEIKSL